MNGPIQFGGLASGLDTSAIISALVGAQAQPIQLLNIEKDVEQAKLSQINDLQNLVDTLRDSAEDLSTLGDFLSFQVTESLTGYAEFAVTGEAVAGSHTLEVSSLATADRYSFDAVADADTTTLGAGNFSFRYDGTVYSITVAEEDSTLNGIVSAINSEAGDAVTASVVNTGTDQSPAYQLVLSGNDTGEDFQIASLNTGTIALGTATQLTTATNAEITVDGLTVERSTNEFSDVIPGVTIDAISETPTGEPITFTIDPDTESIKEKLQGFVDAYNDVIGYINDQNSFDEEEGIGGELFGDSALSTVRSTIQNALFNVDIDVVQADTAGFSTLGLVGLDLQSDGTLQIDSTTLDEKLAEDIDAFADLFVDTDGFDNADAEKNTPEYYQDTTADSGLFDTLYREIDRIVKAVQADDGTLLKGVFGRRKETFNTNIDRIDDRIGELEERLEQFESDLVLRFSALEELMAGLNSQQSFLGSFAAQQSQG